MADGFILPRRQVLFGLNVGGFEVPSTLVSAYGRALNRRPVRFGRLVFSENGIKTSVLSNGKIIPRRRHRFGRLTATQLVSAVASFPGIRFYKSTFPSPKRVGDTGFFIIRKRRYILRISGTPRYGRAPLMVNFTSELYG
jgi:hypothetical protein